MKQVPAKKGDKQKININMANADLAETVVEKETQSLARFRGAEPVMSSH